MSWRRLKDALKTSWRRLEGVLKRFLQDVLKTFWRHMTKTNVLVLIKTSWRRLECVFWRRMIKVNIFVLIKTSWRRLEDTFWWERRKTSSRRLHQDNVCWVYPKISWKTFFHMEWFNKHWATVGVENNVEDIDLNHQRVPSFKDDEVTAQNSHFEENGPDLESDISENTERENRLTRSMKTIRCTRRFSAATRD